MLRKTLYTINIMNNSPFLLDNTIAYQKWRARKLADYPKTAADLLVEINDPFNLTEAEYQAMYRRCSQTNMVLYHANKSMDKAAVAALGQRFGLRRLDRNLCADKDGIATLQVSDKKRPQEYIPYSNRPINWHTDGYYNQPASWVHGVILHCVQAAGQGGENAYLDHEIAYLLLRDENPAWCRALMQPTVMTIPANIENGVEIRAAQTGAVFSLDTDTQALHMRYTARTRSIEWAEDADTQAACQFLTDLFNSDNAYIFRYKLNPNEGVLCNNVLHNRTGFVDDAHAATHRLLYRARYFDRVANISSH